MKKKKDIEIAYSEPENYFPKEVRDKYFNEVEPSIKGIRAVFCKDKYLIIEDNITEELECVEVCHYELYSPDGDITYRYYLLIYSKSKKAYQVFINKREYNKLFKIEEDEFFPIVADIINEDKRGKNISNIRIVNIIIFIFTKIILSCVS